MIANKERLHYINEDGDLTLVGDSRQVGAGTNGRIPPTSDAGPDWIVEATLLADPWAF